MTHSTVHSPNAARTALVAVDRPVLALVPTGDSVSRPEPSTGPDPTSLERAADRAMDAACAAIADTASNLLQHAADVRVARVAADLLQAGAIAACAAQVAAAIKLGNEATALRTAWTASKTAQLLTDQTLPGDELAAEETARTTAALVARTAQTRAAGLADAAHQAELSVTAAAEDVLEAAATMELATTLAALRQDSAVGGIAFHMQVQVALNAS